MRLLINFLVFGAICYAQQFNYSVIGGDAGPWPEILSSIGLFSGTYAEPDIVVARSSTPAASQWDAKLEAGTFLVLEGDSSLARSFGFVPKNNIVKIASITDRHMPETPLILERAIELSEPTIPKNAIIFASERWTHVPVIAGFTRGKGGVLWLATNPGPHGYERFPFLANALCDLGFVPPFRGNRLWAFFDYSYRTRVDVNWFAKKWHESGIAALQVAAWHFYDVDPERDRYLNQLIEACHREGVLVYAWLELPHVSEKFWADHPAWREKTALLQDAQLDWRKLMNLANPECATAVRLGLRSLVGRFDWDGVNLAELYYESLEGASNPARFTPLNDNMRQQFQSEPGGFDPVELWSKRTDAASLRKFLDFRAAKARALQNEWLAEAEQFRTAKPDLDLVLTHVDDRLDSGMRDAIGADTSELVPLLNKHRFTFLVEDPATVWDQGPKRYPVIASKYPPSPQIAVDINIVERYQDVYPTKQQTGMELLGLVHLANISFGRVALYIENSLAAADLPLLDAAASDITAAAWRGKTLQVDSKRGGGVRWPGSATVDGKVWPVQDGGTVWLPPGVHIIEHADAPKGLRLLSLSGEIRSASTANGALQFSYQSDARVIARFSSPIATVQVDGAKHSESTNPSFLLLPRGSHTVLAWPQRDEPRTTDRRNP